MIEKLKSRGAVNILDIGCGCGCIGVSLAYYLPRASVACLDVSEKALRVAERNGERHRLRGRMNFILRDIKDEAVCAEIRKAEYDCIVSNPPYIPTDDIFDLQTEIVDHEPLGALDGGDDGLDFYRVIIEKTAPKRGGIMAFEVGINQADDVADMMYARGYTGIEIIPDLAGIDRAVLGTL